MRNSVVNKTVLNNKALAYGALNAHYNANVNELFFVNFTNDGLVVNYSLHEGHKELIKKENERLQSLGYTTKVTGRKFHKIEIFFN